jgi:hypothetical protein
MSSEAFKRAVAAVFGFQTVAIFAAIAALLCLMH